MKHSLVIYFEYNSLCDFTDLYTDMPATMFAWTWHSDCLDNLMEKGGDCILFTHDISIHALLKLLVLLHCFMTRKGTNEVFVSRIATMS